MVRRRLFVMVMVFLLIFSYAWSPRYTFSSDLVSNDYVGPGKHETELYIKTELQSGETSAGKVAMWNTREEFIIDIEAREDWQIEEVSIYVGSDSVPISEGGAPKFAQFPYKKRFSSPVSSYELSLNLVDDLNFTWGRRDEGERLQNVAVYAKLVGKGEKVSHDQAWAYGENEFQSNWGWWTRYALSRPMLGHFIDAPVGGLGFKTYSHKGRTDSNGAFDYFEGETVTLNIGSLNLGTTTAKQKITPLDLVGTDQLDDPRVINMARLLQSLDADGDPTHGIAITQPIINTLDQAIDELNITTLDFADSDLVDDLIERTVAYSSGIDGVELNIVSDEEARSNLEKGISSTIFRKNISKTPDMEVAKAKIEMMPVYVPALRSNGDSVELEYTGPDGNILSTRNVAKPLVSVYAGEVPGTSGAMDVFAAISRDEGNTWKRTNLSRSADRSSFTLANGFEYPGNVKKPQVKVKGNKILVVWSSQYARSGRPRYSIRTDDDYSYDDEYYVDDIWGVSGPQRSIDYTKMGFPEVGEIPFSCVWTSRGTISPDTGEITWYKPERLTSGRRDAYQLMMNGAPNAGFAVTWQEDPEGLRPGEEAGPGEGWSGATTNHKTDIWYSYIKWDDFDEIDENFVSGGETKDDEDEEMIGRPKAMVPFSLPVRISDNDILNTENMKLEKDENDNWVPELNDDGKATGSHRYGYEIPSLSVDFYEKTNNQGEKKLVAITKDGRLLDGDTGASRPNIMLQPYTKKDGSYSAWAIVCYEETKGVGSGPPETDTETVTEDVNEEELQNVPEKGKYDSSDRGKKVIDENSDNAESELMSDEETDTETFTEGVNEEELQNVSKKKQYNSSDHRKKVIDENSDNAEPDLVSDEETKEVVLNPAEAVSETDTEKEESGQNLEKGQDRYYPDRGKNVIYHSFDFTKPDLVSAGTILNPQATDSEGNLLYLEDENGNLLYDWNGEEIPAYENARRPRFIIQSKKAALLNLTEDEGTPLVCVFKMGEDGKGRPSDIFMRRWVVKNGDKGNPYRIENLMDIDYIQNISSVTPTETWVNTESSSDDKESIKILQWEQAEENLNDFSWSNPYDDARAHRGFIKGKFLAIAYDWTPNWAAARNGNDVFNLYIRRSFDGGATWTTDPKGEGITHCDTFKVLDSMETEKAEEPEPKEREEVYTFYGPGEFEAARNVSQLRNTKESVIEPRLVGVPGKILTDGETLFPEDNQKTNAFWVTYGTESNPGRNDEEVGEPLDLYYSYSTDKGETYYTVPKTINPDSKGNYAGQDVEVWDWLAKDTGKKVAAQAECQIRMTPDGSIFYAAWNEVGPDGSDVMFRRIMRDGGSIEVLDSTSDTIGPVITISGINNGDVTGSDVSIEISLNETGTWIAYLDKDDEDFAEFGSADVSCTIYADNNPHTYTLKVDAEDGLGNTSSREITFTIDNTLPKITISGVTNGELTGDDKIITVTATGDETTIILIKDEEEVLFSSGDTLSQDGVYSLTVTSINTVHDSTATKTVDFIIDKVEPKITISGIADSETYTSAVTPIIGVNDNHSTAQNITVAAQLNDSNFISGTKVNDNGTHTLTVTATDEAGNENTLAYTFSIANSSTSKDNRSEKNTTETEETSAVLTENIWHGQTTELTTEDNKLKISIPAAATNKNSIITITPVEEVVELESGMIRIGNMIYQIEIKDDDGNNITQFNKDLVLEFSYSDSDIPQDVKEEDLKICYWDEGSLMWIVIPTEVDTISNKITAVTDHLTIYAVMPVVDFPSLKDIKGHWAEKDLYRIVSMKLASGDPSGTMRPEDKISREELAKLVVLAAGLDPDNNPVLIFEDTDKIADWARGYVSTAVKAGMIRGYEDNTFKPKQNVSRTEVVTMIVKALKKQLPAQPQINIIDANDIPRWALPYIAKAVEVGIIGGFPDGTFRSSNNATRAQLAVMISRMLNVTYDK